MNKNIWAIVLAAGKSTRMKQQKMLLPFNGKTIIETVILNILPVLNKKILVVLGSHHDEIKKQIGKLPVKTCMNENYAEGMLSSVICGFRALPVGAEAALVFLGDQPQIPGEVSRLVINAWQNSGKGIIIPVTNGRRGHPVLIETKYKSEIESLDPEKGLRQLMEKFGGDVEEAECNLPEILRDIDTPEEYSKEINLN
jgi:molybdenum cofactor cytidylyltransferase